MMPLVLPFPSIDPVLIEFGPFAVRWYSLAYIGGLVLGWLYIKRLVSTGSLWRGDPVTTPEKIDDLLLWVALGVILGGRLGYVLFYNLPYFLSHPAEILAVWQGGMSFHGGFLGVMVALVVFCRRYDLSILSMFDLAAAAVPIGLFFGRLANFINAELFGRVSDVYWAMVFPGGGPEPRHPSQLYEAFLEGLVMFLVLRFLTHHRGKLATPGFVAGCFAIGYGLSRILVEFFRMPDSHLGYYADVFTMGMFLSVPMVAAGLGLVVNAKRKSP